VITGAENKLNFSGGAKSQAGYFAIMPLRKEAESTEQLIAESKRLQQQARQLIEEAETLNSA
jgi:hypothetical protein